MTDVEYEAPDDTQLLEEYKQFSVWSLIALLAGLFSCLALLESWLYFLGIGSAAIAFLAVYDVLSPQRRKSGLNVALAGLFLSVFCATAAFTHHTLFRQYIIGLARRYGEQWLEIVKANDPYRSYELTLEYPKRQPADTDLKLYYEGKSSLVTARTNHRQVFQSYLEQEPEKSIRAAGSRFQYQFHAFERLVRQPKIERYFIAFWGDFPEEPKRRKFGLEMRRTHFLPPIGTQWNVASVYSIDPFYERKLLVGIIEEQDFNVYQDAADQDIQPSQDQEQTNQPEG